MSKVIIGNIDGFAKGIARFAEPMVLVVLAAKVLEKEDIKKDSDLSKKIMLFGQTLEEKDDG